MNKKGVIIHGSARSNGNTRTIVDHVGDLTGFRVVDLCSLNIGPFDYEFRNKDDDYLPLMRDIVENHQTIVVATPVYWYSMSGIMKNFVDRFTDLLRSEKELGRKLRGKNMAMISCGSDKNIPGYFGGPFEATAGYLGMNYLGDIHTWVDGNGVPDEVTQRLNSFVEKLEDRIRMDN